jgi:hypothetical protein
MTSVRRAVFWFLGVLAAVTACAFPTPAVTDSPASMSRTAPRATAPAPTLLVSMDPFAHTPPPWAFALEAQLQCDGPAQSTGGELGEFGPGDGEGPTPQSALDALLGLGFFASFPAGGFDDAGVSGPWARHVYQHGGQVRAIAITTTTGEEHTPGSWVVAAIRACDPSEFDPADGLTFDLQLWLGADGRLARSDMIRSTRGPGHCGADSATWLRFAGQTWFRDPMGVMAGQSVVPFDHDVALPEDAVNTGFHTEDLQLFTVPAGDAAYVQTASGRVERWGRSRDPDIGCA